MKLSSEDPQLEQTKWVGANGCSVGLEVSGVVLCFSKKKKKAWVQFHLPGTAK